MSFLSELKNQRKKLRETETVVTFCDGRRFLESKNDTKETLPSSHGFVLDTKPDNIPVLIKDYLYIGSQDCAVRDVIQSYNIKHVLSLGINVDTNVNFKYILCLDLPETDIKPILLECLPFIRKAIELKENVLVHCNAGVSRTAMVVIAYLMQYENMTFEDAYKWVKNKRPSIQPNVGFKKQLKGVKPGEIIYM